MKREESTRYCKKLKTAHLFILILPCYLQPLHPYHTGTRLPTMTTLNPSHNIFRASSGRHAQAVYHADDLPPSEKPSSSSSAAGGASGFPDLCDDLGIDDSVGEKRGRREGRKRVRAAMPPMPDLRFEQVRRSVSRSCLLQPHALVVGH
jgi:hypothetical protein